MAVGQKYPQCINWIDIETTGLPVGNDFSRVHILEIASVLTDFDLEKYSGYVEVIKMTPEAATEIRANDYVRKMHTVNGLLKDSVHATATLAEAEQEIIKMMKERTTFEKGEFFIGGSGVGTFDFALLKDKMPELASWFAYYPFDIGVDRRVTKILAGKDVINPTKESYQDGVKAHRALTDVEAHILEAQRKRDWLRSVT